MLIPLFFIRWSRRRNIISSIRNFNDEVLTLDQDISEAFSAYYMALWSPPEQNHSSMIFPALPLLSAVNIEQLLRPFSPAEILRTLHSMSKGKAPGPDGYPVEFFQTCWPEVGSSILAAFFHFFDTGFLPAARFCLLSPRMIIRRVSRITGRLLCVMFYIASLLKFLLTGWLVVFLIWWGRSRVLFLERQVHYGQYIPSLRGSSLHVFW